MSNSKDDFDLLQRFVFESCDIRGEIVTLHNTFVEASAHQSLTPVEQNLLGEFLAATALLGDSLKFKGVLTLQARGDGVIPLLMADINHEKQLRGIVKRQPDATFGKAGTRLPELLGNAVLSMTIDPDQGERYQGIVPLQGDDIARCLNNYFAQSEQLPSFFLCFAQQSYCGGIFLQALPAQIIKDKEQAKDKWDTLVQLVSTLKTEELFTLPHEEILFRLFHEMQCKIFPPRPVEFKCSCNIERSSNAIAALGREDAYALLQEEEGEIEINCEFCGQTYLYDEQSLDELFGASH